jgi:hypothetical protein
MRKNKSDRQTCSHPPYEPEGVVRVHVLLVQVELKKVLPVKKDVMWK